MKWLSVKKHEPPPKTILFIRNLHGAYEIAQWFEETQQFDCLHFMNGIPKNCVSHFCIPDPVEDEDD